MIFYEFFHETFNDFLWKSFCDIFNDFVWRTFFVTYVSLYRRATKSNPMIHIRNQFKWFFVMDIFMYTFWLAAEKF